jgi:hypothetical protein
MQKSSVGESEIAESLAHPFASRQARSELSNASSGRPVGDAAAPRIRNLHVRAAVRNEAPGCSPVASATNPLRRFKPKRSAARDK